MGYDIACVRQLGRTVAQKLFVSYSMGVGTVYRTAAILLAFCLVGFAQNSTSVTVTEPRQIELARLFQTADTVAVVRVISGDTENYAKAMYKAEVVRSFKGADGKTLYFGPYVGFKVGAEYLLFLHTAKELAVPKTAPNAMYGAIRYGDVFDEGYSSMAASYECVFEGKEVNHQCDYGIRVCTDYISLPPTVRTFPPKNEETDFGCRWVKRAAMEALVQEIASSSAR
jgi:hypothetical protein